MSRMTKFLKQTCRFQQAKHVEDNNVALNKFGEIIYGPVIILKCRRERVIQDTQTSNGAVLSSYTRYYTDEKQVIQIGDKLDGKPVNQLEEYINQAGVTEGYLSYV